MMVGDGAQQPVHLESSESAREADDRRPRSSRVRGQDASADAPRGSPELRPAEPGSLRPAAPKGAIRDDDAALPMDLADRDASSGCSKADAARSAQWLIC